MGGVKVPASIKSLVWTTSNTGPNEPSKLCLGIGSYGGVAVNPIR